MNESHEPFSLTTEEIARKIVEAFDEFNAASLVMDITAFCGPEKTNEFFQETISIIQRGGKMTKKGDRKRTSGGTFFSHIKENVTAIEREMLFPRGKVSIPDEYMLDAIEKFNLNQLEIGARRIEETMRGVGYPIEQDNRLNLLRLRELLLKRIAELKGKETQESFKAVIETVNELPDDATRSLLISRIENLEVKTSNITETAKETVAVEQQRQRMQIQLEAEERRAKTRLRYLERLLERESVATMLGSILLSIITLTLIIGMFAGKIETKIIENGFLVLLGYFFGQTTGRSTKQNSE